MQSIPEDWKLRIKAATRDLVAACGGVARAAALANMSRTEASRWQLTHEPIIISVAGIVALEADCGVPYVTRQLAEISGSTLTETIAPDPVRQVPTEHAHVLREVADLMETTADALEDGRLSPSEAETIDREASELERQLHRLRQALAAVKGRGAALRSVR